MLKSIFVRLAIAYFVVFFLAIIISGRQQEVAVETGFVMRDYDSDKSSGIELLADELRGEEIICYDVNDNGDIAIGMQNIDDWSRNMEKIISIYNSEGYFLYGYRFNQREKYLFEWKDGHIFLYSNEMGIATLLDDKGNVLERKEIIADNSTAIGSNQRYWKSLNRTEIEVNGDTYFLEKSKKISKTDDNGNVEIVFDLSSKNKKANLKNNTITFLIVGCILFGFIRMLYKPKSK